MSKYGNIRTEVDGIKFASKREAVRYSQLKLLERAGEIEGLRRQVPYQIEVNGQKVCKYVADAVYYAPAGPLARLVVEDCKGVRTAIYRLKAKLLKAAHGIEIQEVAA